jgi:hypothetical protein
MITLGGRLMKRKSREYSSCHGADASNATTALLADQDPKRHLAFTMKRVKSIGAVVLDSAKKGRILDLYIDHEGRNHSDNGHPRKKVNNGDVDTTTKTLQFKCSLTMSTIASPSKSSLKKPSTLETDVRSPGTVDADSDDQSKPVTNKQVRFWNIVTVLKVDSYNEKEKAAMYMSRQDAKDIHDRIRQSTYCMSFPECYTVDQQDELLESTRGLLTVKGTKDRMKRKNFVRKVVMYAQDREQVHHLTTMRCDDDDEEEDEDDEANSEHVWFVEKFRSINEESAMQARAAAWDDEQEALAVYNEAGTLTLDDNLTV